MGFCNAYTCSPNFKQYCQACPQCKASDFGVLCESYCNEYTCSHAECSGCSNCNGIESIKVDIDVDAKVARTQKMVSISPIAKQNTMHWDRFQVEEKLHLWGRLLDNHDQHCTVDGFCFGDLFTNNAWMCSVNHTNVNTPFPDWSAIYPGAPPTAGGAISTGPTCQYGLQAQAGGAPGVMTSEANRVYGGTGVFRTNGMQPRHTLNNLVVTRQTETEMTTLNYLIIERWFNRAPGANTARIPAPWIGYDGSAYVYQTEWVKQGGLWKIKEARYCINGHGHFGHPEYTTASRVTSFVTELSNLAAAAGRRLGLVEEVVEEAEKPFVPPTNKRLLQTAPLHGNFDPTISRVPTPSSDAESIQMIWDRYEIMERISMYSWLADEVRVNDPKGFLWGDQADNNATFCIHGEQPGYFDMPSFDNNIFGGPWGGGGCGAAPAPCTPGINGPGTCQPQAWAAGTVSMTGGRTCAKGMGINAPGCMQGMIRGTFGFNSFMQGRHQQTRHTLTNLIFLSQTPSLIFTQVTNTLQRYVSGVAYDSSAFVYQHRWIKRLGVWKWSYINAVNMGHGYMGGAPSGSQWTSFLAGLAGATGHGTTIGAGRRLQYVANPTGQPNDSPSSTYSAVWPGQGAAGQGSGQGHFSTKGNPYLGKAPYIEGNPLVARVPIAAVEAMQKGDLSLATVMAWDRRSIIERLHMYPYLCDEARRNTPKGLLWHELFKEDTTFCIYNYHNVTNVLPDFDLLGGFTDRSDLSGLQYPRGGFVDSALNKSTCTLGLGPNTAAVLNKMIQFTFGHGFMKSRGQQTRHTFSNVLFGHQTVDTARTYHYNIVERMVSGVAIDGSNFLYRFEWTKASGIWKAYDVRVVAYGDSRMGTAPTGAQMDTLLDLYASFPGGYGVNATASAGRR
jgi:hypothetical protein